MLNSRSLTQNELRQLEAAQLNTMDLAPYYAAALFKLRPRAVENLGTFAVDRHWRLYLDPSTLTEWGPRQSGAVLAHEIGHLLRDHAGRADVIGANFNHEVWNIAGDACINEHLVACGFPLPEGVVTPQALGLSDNGIEEEYYQTLMQHAPTPPDPQSKSSPGSDDPGCGSGAGGPSTEWELDPNDPTTPGLSPAGQTVVRRQVADSIRRTEHTQPGTTPAGLQRWAEQTLAPPVVNWRKQLQSAVRRAITWSRDGQTDYTYARPGRRRIPGIITPSMHTPVPNVAAVIDTSGSMSKTALASALSEITGIVRHTRAHGITVVSVDTQTTISEHITAADQVTLTGGGGTDMRVGIAAALNHRSKIDTLVVLTDGYTPWPSAPIAARLIVVLIGSCPAHTVPDWATVVRVPDER